MTTDQALEHFKTQTAIAKALGRSVTTVNYWFTQGKKIPYEAQHQLEVITCKRLRADPVTVPR